MMIRTPQGEEIPIDVIQIEEPLQLGDGAFASKSAVRSDLLVAQELHRHESRR